MSHEVETMFSARELPWHGLGVVTDGDLTSEEALKTAGLDWKVKKEQLFLADGIEVPNQYATVRDSDRKPLGVVGDRYTVMQNVDAFAFADNLLEAGAKFTTAGSLYGGSRVFLTALLESREILGDEHRTYLVVTNSHDGWSPAKGMITPVRVVCANTERMALQQAVSTFSIRHTKNMMDRIAQAKKALSLSAAYVDHLAIKAEELALAKVSKKQVEKLINKLFGEAKAGEQRNFFIQQRLDDFMLRLDAPDLANFKGSAWGVYQALIDHHAHRNPAWETPGWRQSRFLEVMEDSKWIDDATKQLLALV